MSVKLKPIIPNVQIQSGEKLYQKLRFQNEQLVAYYSIPKFKISIRKREDFAEIICDPHSLKYLFIHPLKKQNKTNEQNPLRVSMCSPCCPGTRSVVHDNHKLRDGPGLPHFLVCGMCMTCPALKYLLCGPLQKSLLTSVYQENSL